MNISVSFATVNDRQSQLQHHPDFHITSSTILASTLHITGLNTRNEGSVNNILASGPGFRIRLGSEQAIPADGVEPPGPQQCMGSDNLAG